MPCTLVLNSQCSNGHKQTWQCQKGPPALCQKCEQKKKRDDDNLRREFELQQQRDTAQRQHDAELAKLEAQISEQQALIRDAQLAEDRRAALEQKRSDLANVADSATRAAARQSHTKPAEPAQSPAPPKSLLTSLGQQVSSVASAISDRLAGVPESSSVQSPSADEWCRQQQVDGEKNDALDDLMGMTGLEDVKAQALAIKAKIDTLKRQGVTLKGERFNCVFQGNPGTGMPFCSARIRCLQLSRKDDRRQNICKISRECRRAARNRLCRDYWSSACQRGSQQGEDDGGTSHL